MITENQVSDMNRSTTLSIFLASTAVLSSTLTTPISLADTGATGGGLTEWSTDQNLDAEAVKDADAQRAADKADEEDICIPIGEGENCW